MAHDFHTPQTGPSFYEQPARELTEGPQRSFSRGLFAVLLTGRRSGEMTGVR